MSVLRNFLCVLYFRSTQQFASVTSLRDKTVKPTNSKQIIVAYWPYLDRMLSPIHSDVGYILPVAKNFWDMHQSSYDE